jgi:signal transduction histidine kinase/PAS domain-containing protein
VAAALGCLRTAAQAESDGLWAAALTLDADGGLAPCALVDPNGLAPALPRWPARLAPELSAALTRPGARRIASGEGEWGPLMRACGAGAMVVFPLMADADVLGVGVLAAAAPEALGNRHVALCRDHGRLLGLALAGEAAGRRHQQLTALVERLPTGLVLLDAVGDVITINPAARQALGVSEVPAGTRFANLERAVLLQRPDGRPVSANQLPSSCLARGEDFSPIETLIVPEGRMGEAYGVSGFALPGPDGEPGGAACVYQDRGRLWQREAELAALYALTAAAMEADHLECLLERALGHILSLTHLPTGLLLYHGAEHPEPVVSQQGLPASLVASAQGFAAELGLHRLYRCLVETELAASDPAPEAVLRTLLIETLCTWVVLPLRRDRQLVGLLLLGPADYGQLSDELSRLLVTITNQLLMAIERSQAKVDLEQLVARRTTELLESHQRLEATVAELRRMDQFKTNFLSNVSHELRTPLSGIIGYGEFLAEGVYGDLTPDQGEILNKLVESGYKLMDLINNLLDLSRIDAGRLTLYKEPIELGVIVEQSIGQVLPKAMQKGIHLDLPAGGTPAVDVDPGRIVQVLVNLLFNAIKFTPDGGTIRVTFQAAGGEVTVAVSDTGIGIPAEHLPLLFVRFSQVDASSTRQFEGTGLGLAICRELIELHAQRIWVESTPGRGSTFYFTLPIWQTEPEPAMEPASA